MNQVNNEINHENQKSLSGQSMIQDAPTAKAVFLEELRNIETILKESMKCLEHEAENTVEGVTYKMAKKALNDIGEILFFSEFI